MRLSVSDWAANQAVQRAFSDALPESMPLGQKMVLSALFICAEGPDQPVEESHTDLAALAGFDLAGYFSRLLKLKFAGFVTDEWPGPSHRSQCHPGRRCRRWRSERQAVDARFRKAGPQRCLRRDAGAA